MATTTTPAPSGAIRPRFRLSTMEVLGFIETPGLAITSTVTRVDATANRLSPPDPASSGAASSTANDPFADWRPQELGSRFFKGRIRWGMVLVVGGVLAVTAAGAVWAYQKPESDARRARQEVVRVVSEVRPELDRLRLLNQTLTGASIDAVEVNAVMLAVDAGVRRLLAAGADLPTSEGPARNRLFEAADDTADALRRFSDAYAHRSGVVPILAAPPLESDPGLISLEQAAATFSDWQARFEAVRSALPEESLGEVTDALAVLSARLPELQREYLDALRIEDVAASTRVIGQVEQGLAAIEEVLFQSLALIQSAIDELVDSAGAAMDQVISLFG